MASDRAPQLAGAAGMRIAVLDDYLDQALTLAEWGDLARNVTVFTDTVSGQALIDRLQPFQVVCLMRERTALPGAVIAQLPNLQLIVATGKRNPSIDMAAARARGIPVCGTESRDSATTHLTMTLILALMRGLLPEAHSMRTGGWQSFRGRDLAGLTLGLVGLGKKGSAIARLAQAFEMNVIAWSQNLTKARCAEVGGVTHAGSLEALMARSDVVSLHVVLSERTRAMIGARELGMMKPDAALINTSRGPIVDQSALLAALRAGRPGMAALDVFDQEPLAADDPLRDRALIDAGKLLLTPHLGYGAQQTYTRMYTETVENIRAWIAGAPIRRIDADTPDPASSGAGGFGGVQ